MANVTINIKNCGCGGTKTTTPSDPFSVGGGATGEWASPDNNSGPPEGFFEPISELSDRQCKVAVWLYDWLDAELEFFGETTLGGMAVGTFRVINIIPIAVLRRVILAALPTLVGLLTGVELSDVVLAWLSWVMAGSIVAALAGVNYNLITQPLIQDARAKIFTQKDQLICQLAKASDGLSAFQDFQKAIEGLDLIFEQKQLVIGFVPVEIFNLLYYTSDFWPSFDEDFLAGITTTCCGGLVNDDPITPASQQHCQASWFIVDQLAATMNAVYNTKGIWYNANPFDDRRDIYQCLDTNLQTPFKIRERAYRYPSFLNAVTEITYSKFFLTAHLADLSEFGDFATYIAANGSTLTTALQAAVDPSDAYDALQPLRDWINDTNNVSGTATRDYMLQALDALIKVRPDGLGIMDLLFRQDADLAFYALDKCTSGAADGYIATVDNVEILKSTTVVEDENNFVGAEDDSGMLIYSNASQSFVNVETDFGQVYNDAIQLELRVKTEDGLATWRRPYKADIQVKENIGDPWVSVGEVYFDQADMDDGQWHWRTRNFGARPVRYARMRVNNGTNAFGYYFYLRYDALKVVTQ